MRLRQRNPGLDAVHAMTGGALRSWGPLRMHNAASGDHPVDVTGTHHLPATEAIVVGQRAFVEIGDRGEADVRMRAYIKPATRHPIHGTDRVEEHEWPDLPAQAGRQQPARRETITQIVQTRFDEERRVRGHVGAAGRDAA